MKISRALTEVRLLYIETAPFIYYTENRPGYVDTMRAIFQGVLDQQMSIVTSTIALAECLPKPLKENDRAVVKAYETLFQNTKEIRLVPVDAAVARRCADLRAQYNLRTPDALHVATAIETGCDIFLTNDLTLKRVKEVRVLVLNELELDSSTDEG